MLQDDPADSFCRMVNGMQIGVFGGTFNPIHRGHIRLCETAKEQLGLDRVLMIPAGMPPHKIPPELASGQDRAEMCRIAAAGRPWLTVDERELRAAGKNYTVDTLASLVVDYPEDAFTLIIGSDMLTTFHQWREYRRILGICRIGALCRSEAEQEAFADAAERLCKEGGKIERLTVPPMEVSSTQIRQWVKTEPSRAAALLPEGVAEYIMTRGLYR